MARRRDAILAQGLPWLVAERGGQVLGYAYAAVPAAPRLPLLVEDSIYLAPEARGQGVGRLLLAELIARCEAPGIRQMLAVIGDSENAGSIAVHRACGFEHTGMFRAAGGSSTAGSTSYDAAPPGPGRPPPAGRGDAPRTAGLTGSAPAAPLAGGGSPSKTLATWIAVIGGSFGLHHVYLGGRGRWLGRALSAADARRTSPASCACARSASTTVFRGCWCPGWD